MLSDNEEERLDESGPTELGTMENIEIGGQTEITDDVIGAIAGVAAREIEGVSSLGTSSIRRTIAERVGRTGKRTRRSRGVKVESGRREAVLDIELRVIYGASIPDTVVNVRENVSQRILELCGLVAKEINISVVGIDFPDRTSGRVQ